ncbi:MAG: hypothetical protein CMH44_14665 [Muricauda sp.]|nr:hypothetical protein [Allomuricauda sp.]|tara:strand:+ start:208 stop:3759 length:3552 start_codon:yes stop_codon:yes gene_type:complete
MVDNYKTIVKTLKTDLGFSDIFVESVREGLLITDVNGKIIIVNSSLCELTGFVKEELLGAEAPFPFWPTELKKDFLVGFKKTLKEGIRGEHETVHMRKDGSRFPVSIFSASIRNRQGEIIAHLGLLKDFDKMSREILPPGSENLDVFSILNYRSKYGNLLAGKELVSQLDFTLNNISDGIISLNREWCITYVNGNAAEIMDRTAENLIGKHFWTEFPDVSDMTFHTMAHRALETQKKQESEEYYTPFDKWFENRFYPSQEGLTIFFSDISERRLAENLLLENKEYLDNIINNIGDPLFVKDAESRILLANEAFCTMFGLSGSELFGKTLAEDVAPEERESFLRIDREVIESGIENVNEESLTVRGGQTKIISTKKTRFVDEKGNKFLIGIIRDITDRKKAELVAQAAKEYSEGLIESMHEGLVVFNLETEIISVNPSFCRMSGFSESELIGKQCPYPFSPPEIEEESNLRHEKIERGEQLDNFETIYMRKDGSRFNVDVMISLLRGENGGVHSYFATIIDTTERKRAELELKLAKEFTDNLIMSMQEGLIIVDPKGEIILVNDSTCDILGYSKEELVGLNLPYPFARPEDFEEIVKTSEMLARGEQPAFQFEFVRKNGEPFLATFLSGNITNDDGEVIAHFGTMKDISEEVKAKAALEENALRSSEKKDVILKLAGLVGKDFHESLDKITELAAITLNVGRVSVWSFESAGNGIFCQNLYSRNNDVHSNGLVIKKADNPNYFAALEKNQSIKIENACENRLTKDFAEPYLIPNNIKSLMDVFINSTNGYYGILCFEHVGADFRTWTADDQEFASSIANIVSLMVESHERKAAEEKLKRSNQELSKANDELMVLRNQLEQENTYLRNELDLVFNFEEMIYGSALFSNVLTEVEKVATTNATVLLLGESGTGKELLARAVHNISLRNEKPLIKVNCSAIPRELIESELFGHKKGSFTGAFSDKVGKFELADGGTLFLDEIGELPLDMQPKILRFLQEGEIEVVGGVGTKKLDVRVIAATNRNLREEIEKKRFREDLYFRLNVFPIEIPPLRKRREDIPLLVEHFMDKFNKEYGKEIKYVSEPAMEKLKNYDWPGNIRELENLIERASILTSGDTLVIPGFESPLQQSRIPVNGHNLSLDSVQRNHIVNVLEQCNWKISGDGGASTLLNLKPSTLRDKMAKLGIKK